MENKSSNATSLDVTFVHDRGHDQVQEVAASCNSHLLIVSGVILMMVFATIKLNRRLITIVTGKNKAKNYKILNLYDLALQRLAHPANCESLNRLEL